MGTTKFNDGGNPTVGRKKKREGEAGGGESRNSPSCFMLPKPLRISLMPNGPQAKPFCLDVYFNSSVIMYKK